MVCRPVEVMCYFIWAVAFEFNQLEEKSQKMIPSLIFFSCLTVCPPFVPLHALSCPPQIEICSDYSRKQDV